MHVRISVCMISRASGRAVRHFEKVPAWQPRNSRLPRLDIGLPDCDWTIGSRRSISAPLQIKGRRFAPRERLGAPRPADPSAPSMRLELAFRPRLFRDAPPPARTRRY